MLRGDVSIRPPEQLLACFTNLVLNPGPECQSIPLRIFLWFDANFSPGLCVCAAWKRSVFSNPLRIRGNDSYGSFEVRLSGQHGSDAGCPKLQQLGAQAGAVVLSQVDGEEDLRVGGGGQKVRNLPQSFIGAVFKLSGARLEKEQKPALL